MELVLPKQMILLRAKNNNIMGFREKGKSYVVGFKAKVEASTAAKYVAYGSKMTMREVNFENIKTDMELLDPKMVEVPFKKLMMDVDAKLVVEKKQRPGKLVEHVVPSDEFLMYPMTRNVGVVIIESLERETSEHLIYNMHVVAPTFTPEMFEL